MSLTRVASSGSCASSRSAPASRSAALPTAGAFDLAELARRYQMSGGYIRNATLRAAFLAAEEHAPLTQEHLERAIKAEFREIGKIAESGILE
jgi:hypothetical protein